MGRCAGAQETSARSGRAMSEAYDNDPPTPATAGEGATGEISAEDISAEGAAETDSEADSDTDSETDSEADSETDSETDSDSDSDSVPDCLLPVACCLLPVPL